MRWRCLAIEREDILCMPPFTPHFVLTTEDCFAVGGHFYNYKCMEKTIEAIVVEHYFGLNWVNTEHPTAPIILFKMLDELLQENRILHAKHKEDGPCKRPLIPLIHTNEIP